ncbi:MAG: hypothetical protein Q8K58_03225 [Acidimicrobiales bacterium]|nr:hypothetical protein [Acidimicrobiales bacterium]
MSRATLTRPMLLAAAAFTAAGGFVHGREWLVDYRDVPAAAPGSWLVRIGFPVNAGLSVLLVIALVLVALRLPRFAVPVALGVAGFQAGTLALVIATRTGTVFGWTEPVWTRGADQSRAVAIGALLVLGAAAALHVVGRATPRRPVPATA